MCLEMNSDVELNSINLQLASQRNMDKWVLSDWANAWKSPIPTKNKRIQLVLKLVLQRMKLSL